MMNARHTLVLFVGALSLSACSGVKFSKDTGSSQAAQAAGDSGKDGDSDGQVTQPGGSGTGDSAGGQVTQPGGTGTGPGGTDVSNAGGTPGPVTGSGNTAAAILPKLQFIGPECVRLTNCAVIFRLDKAYPARTVIDWKTNDALYASPAPAGLAPFGRGVPSNSSECPSCYVTTSGHVVFPAGTTEQTVYVRNINSQNVPITIPVLMSNCVYNGLFESCQKFFSP